MRVVWEAMREASVCVGVRQSEFEAGAHWVAGGGVR